MQNNRICTNPPLNGGVLLTCTRCSGWFSSLNDPHWRCDNCGRLLEEDKVQLVRQFDEQGLCFCGAIHADGLAWRRCACICGCEEEERLIDPDYEWDPSESEDDLDESLTGQAAEGEQDFARTYGWQTNFISNENTDVEHRFFFENPGHRSVAQMHDIGIPAESSLPNSENIIPLSEANSLTGRTAMHNLRGRVFLARDLEPWEFDAVEQSSTLSRRELLEIYPEARQFQFSDPASVELQPVRRLLCRQCLKQFSQGAMDALAVGDLDLCQVCYMIEHPRLPAGDPDRSDFEAGIPGTLDNCHCRCRCQPEERAPEPEVSTDLTQLERRLNAIESQYQATQETMEQLDIEQQMGRQLAEAGEVVRLSRANAQQRRDELAAADSPDHRPVDGPLIRAPLQINTNVPQADIEMELASPSPLMLEDPQARESLRVLYDLPELHLSNDEDLQERTLEDVRNAVEGAQIAQSFDEPEEARNYLRAARALGQMGGMNEDSQTMNYIRFAISELDEVILNRQTQLHQHAFQRW